MQGERLLLNCMSSFYILDMNTLSDIWFADTFLILYVVFTLYCAEAFLGLGLGLWLETD